VRVITDSSNTYYYAYTDHLGNITGWSDAAGVYLSNSIALHEPFGAYRFRPPASVNPGISDRGFTGHRMNNTGTNDLGLIYMNARYYMPEIGRFISADTIVPEPGNPQSYNRYSYTRNNPMNFTDPTGHRECIDELCDLVWNEQTNRPNLRGSLPAAIGYIFGEMTANATSITANVIHAGNIIADIPFATGTSRAMGYLIANAVWGSQVMDARLKERIGALAPYIANWDHKPVLRGIAGPSPVQEIVERGNSSRVGSEFYRFDIWSNIHYGYVGVASGFSESELINGAGAEQIGSVLYSGGQPSSSPNSPTWLSSWDEPSDTASIQIGSTLWNNYGLNVTPADLYLAVIDETRLCSTQCLGAGQ